MIQNQKISIGIGTKQFRRMFYINSLYHFYLISTYAAYTAEQLNNYNGEATKGR